MSLCCFKKCKQKAVTEVDIKGIRIPYCEEHLAVIFLTLSRDKENNRKGYRNSGDNVRSTVKWAWNKIALSKKAKELANFALGRNQLNNLEK